MPFARVEAADQRQKINSSALRSLGAWWRSRRSGHVTWIRFYGLGEDNDAFIGEEKHKLKLADYYDTWMLVQKRDM